jgi:hypothetical protein
MYDLEMFVIAVYCLVTEVLYPSFCQRYGTPRRAGFEPALSDEECLTIELVGQFLGYATQKQLYERMHERFGEWFPALTDRVAFVRQSANLWQVKACLQQDLVHRLGGDQCPCQIIDTLPIPLCKVTRRFQRRIFRTDPVFDFPQPTKGYCAAKEEEYFGFKGGLRITDYGLIVHAPLLQAYGHDSQCRDQLLVGVPAYTLVLADAAFLDLEWQQQCQQHQHIRILTPIKSNMEPTPDRNPFILKRLGNSLRRLIETVYAQLTQRLQVAAIKARDAWHFQNLWITKILTHTVCVFLNIQLQRQPLDFEGLVRF